jgi:tetratricopeptide (TPR) repeat protein
MPKIRARHVVAPLIAVMLLGSVAQAEPQAARSAEERRMKREREKEAEQQQQQEQPAQPARYPQATRKEPDAKASAKRTPELKKMFDAFNAGDSATVLSIADPLIADESANAYERAVSARLAGASLLNTDNAKAQAYLQKAVELDGLSNNEHYESMFLAAQLQMQEKQYAQALATVEKFMAETKSQEPDQLALKGNALYRLKKYPEAADALKQAIAASPQPKPEWQQLLMQTYADMGQPQEASKLAEQIAGSAPADTTSQLNLAATYMQSGQDDKAAAVLEKLRASGGLTGEQDYKNLYALYANAEGKEKETIAVINEGLQKGILKPDYQTYTALAQAYWFSEQPGPAIEAYKKAAPLAPDGESYLNLARALTNEGRTAEARQAAQQALAKGVKKPEEAQRIAGGK